MNDTITLADTGFGTAIQNAINDLLGVPNV